MNQDFETQHNTGVARYLMQKCISASWSPTGDRQMIDYRTLLSAAQHGASMDAPEVLTCGSWIADEWAHGPSYGVRE
jgi:hypothetical protein